MEQDKEKSLTDKVWGFFASVKFAIIIFALIAATSIIGTVLDQNAEPAKNLKIIAKLFNESAAPTLYDIFDKFGFFNMYRSWWFVTLLVLFAVNLIICSLDRLPKIWKLVREPVSPLPEETLRKFLINREFSLKGSPDTVKAHVSEALKSAGFRCNEAKEEKGVQFFGQKWNYSRLGVYLTHTSILFILIGALIGLNFGFKGFMEVAEGTVSNTVIAADKAVPLDFLVKCDNFETDFYGSSDMPKEYKSWLTIIKDGKEVMSKTITVNDPLTYEGITFYQSSYGIVPNGLTGGIFIFNIVSRDGKASLLNLRFGESFQIPGTALTGRILDFSPAMRYDEHGHAVNYANMMNNPAVFLDFTESGKHKFSGWIFKRHPESWQLPDGNRVEFHNYWGVEYTGLQVRKDPGVWLVYLGCIVMSIGLFTAFFLSHRRIWVKLISEKQNTKVIIGANTNKNRAAFERKIDALISTLTKKQEGVK